MRYNAPMRSLFRFFCGLGVFLVIIPISTARHYTPHMNQICHVMAKSLATDGEDSPLREALTQVIAHDSGSVLCCLPGRLAFHKAEAIEGAWYIFERKQEPAARL